MSEELGLLQSQIKAIQALEKVLAMVKSGDILEVLIVYTPYDENLGIGLDGSIPTWENRYAFIGKMIDAIGGILGCWDHR